MAYGEINIALYWGMAMLSIMMPSVATQRRSARSDAQREMGGRAGAGGAELNGGEA